MDTEKVSMLLRALKMPFKVKWYEVDGKIIFPLAIVDKANPNLMCYLIKYPHNTLDRTAPWYKYAIELRYDMTPMQAYEVVRDSISKFREILKSKDKLKNYKFNPNGGDLGRGDNLTVIKEVKKLDYPLEK